MIITVVPMDPLWKYGGSIVVPVSIIFCTKNANLSSIRNNKLNILTIKFNSKLICFK